MKKNSIPAALNGREDGHTFIFFVGILLLAIGILATHWLTCKTASILRFWLKDYEGD